MAKIEFVGDTSIQLVSIPGGTFLMGSSEGELDRTGSESPVHVVEIRPLLLGRYPVTQAQWRAVARLEKVEIYLYPEPSRFEGDRLPVEQVSWLEAKEFCNRLSRLSDCHYRLPTEAEWEYACRAGTTTPFHFGETITTDLANYRSTDISLESSGSYGLKGEYREATTPVGYFNADNSFGIGDAYGNVWEWYEDDLHTNYTGAPTDGRAWVDSEGDRKGKYKVIRGSSWFATPEYCRSACREGFDPCGGNDSIGFRMCRSR